MNKKDYGIALGFIGDYLSRLKKEFKSKMPFAVLRIQIKPDSKTNEITDKISGDIFSKIPAAYNYDNIYFFVLPEDIEEAISMLESIKPLNIETIGSGFIEETKGKSLVCNFAMMYENRRCLHGPVEIDGTELEWIGEPVFTIDI